MRHHSGSGFGCQLGQFAGMLGLVFSCAQGCANGDTKQSDEETGGDGSSTNVGGASTSSDTGTGQGQGGTSSSSTASVGGITSVGGAATGGAASGGSPTTGGNANTSAAGGSETGGVANVGGITATDVGGVTSVGGATPATGGAATGGAPPIECKNSLDCVNVPDGKTVCNPAGQCVECVTPADCGGADAASNHDCINNKCIEFTPCNSEEDCTSGGCSARHRCVECTQDSQCTGNTNKCVSQTCRVACESDNTCTPLHMLCDKQQGVCIECSDKPDDKLTCVQGLLCDPTGKCVPPACTAGERICEAGGGIASCVANGSGFGPAKPCPGGSSCRQEGGVLGCYDADGGLACDVPGDPCELIPMFIGTQTVDGLGDEFCGVPFAILDGTHNKGTRDYHVRAPEIASIQVAWSTAGLHVFVDVQDVAVQTVQMLDPTQAATQCYMGDSIEILFSSSNNVTGLTGTDNNTTHVQIPASGPAVSIKTSNSDGSSQGTPTPLPQAQYSAKISATGYAVEALLPWPGNAKPSTGSTIRFDLTLNSADKNFSGVGDMRDGSLFYHLTEVPNSTCQTTEGLAPYCDDRAWCMTKLQ